MHLKSRDHGAGAAPPPPPPLFHSAITRNGNQAYATVCNAKHRM